MTVLISRKQRVLCLLAIFILGAILRMMKLGSQSFWWDEVYSATFSTNSLKEVASGFGQTPVLYHIILHFWLSLGRSDVFIRSLSVLFGMGALWMAYLLGRALLNNHAGLLSAFLLAISPFHIWYCQEARMYSMLIFLTMVSTLLFIRFLQRVRRGRAISWAIASALALYTHYYAVFVIFFQLIFFLIYRRKYLSAQRYLIVALLVLLVLQLPMFTAFFLSDRFYQVCTVGAGGNPFHFFSLPYTFFTFSLGFSFGPSIAELHRSASVNTLQPFLPHILLSILVFGSLFFLGLSSLWRFREKFVFLFLYLAVPLFSASLASLFLPQFSYNVRYVSVSLLAYLLILTSGLMACRHKILRWILIMGFVIFTSVSLKDYYFEDIYAKENYRQVARVIARDGQDGDIVFTTHLRGFKYYYQGPLLVHNLFWSPKFYRQMIDKQLIGFQRAWVIISREWGSDPQGMLKEHFQSHYPVVSETTFTNVYLGLYDIHPPKGIEGDLSLEGSKE